MRPRRALESGCEASASGSAACPGSLHGMTANSSTLAACFGAALLLSGCLDPRPHPALEPPAATPDGPLDPDDLDRRRCEADPLGHMMQLAEQLKPSGTEADAERLRACLMKHADLVRALLEVHPELKPRIRAWGEATAPATDSSTARVPVDLSGVPEMAPSDESEGSPGSATPRP